MGLKAMYVRMTFTLKKKKMNFYFIQYWISLFGTLGTENFLAFFLLNNAEL